MISSRLLLIRMGFDWYAICFHTDFCAVCNLDLCAFNCIAGGDAIPNVMYVGSTNLVLKVEFVTIILHSYEKLVLFIHMMLTLMIQLLHIMDSRSALVNFDSFDSKTNVYICNLFMQLKTHLIQIKMCTVNGIHTFFAIYLPLWWNLVLMMLNLKKKQQHRQQQSTYC